MSLKLALGHYVFASASNLDRLFQRKHPYCFLVKTVSASKEIAKDIYISNFDDQVKRRVTSLPLLMN